MGEERGGEREARGQERSQEEGNERKERKERGIEEEGGRERERERERVGDCASPAVAASAATGFPGFVSRKQSLSKEKEREGGGERKGKSGSPSNY